MLLPTAGLHPPWTWTRACQSLSIALALEESKIYSGGGIVAALRLKDTVSVITPSTMQCAMGVSILDVLVELTGSCREPELGKSGCRLCQI